MSHQISPNSSEATDTNAQVEQWREFLLSFPASVEEMPFGPEVLVYKLAGKCFALMTWQDEPIFINLKCDLNLAIQLRETYSAVKPGYHMNKVHWNSVTLDGSVSDTQVKEWVKHSYDLIFLSLPKKIQRELQNTQPDS